MEENRPNGSGDSGMTGDCDCDLALRPTDEVGTGYEASCSSISRLRISVSADMSVGDDLTFDKYDLGAEVVKPLTAN